MATTEILAEDVRWDLTELCADAAAARSTWEALVERAGRFAEYVEVVRDAGAEKREPPLAPEEKRRERDHVPAFADAVQKAKPSGAKGSFVKKISISSTMGPGVKIEPSTVFGAEGAKA